MMCIRFRLLKDIAAWPLHLFIRTAAYLPAPLRRICFRALALLGKAYYFTPRSHVRRTLKDLCAVIGRSDPMRIYFRMVDNVTAAAEGFGLLMRHGADAAAQMKVCAWWNAANAKLAHCRVLGHVDLPDLPLGQADGQRDFRVVGDADLHECQGGRGPPRHADWSIRGVRPRTPGGGVWVIIDGWRGWATLDHHAPPISASC